MILIALRDVFHQLVHPSGIGTLNQMLVRVVWSLFHSLAIWWPATLTIAGPLAFVCVIVAWAAMLSIGWALIYWPHLPGSFLFSPGLSASVNGGFLDALYLSLVSLATLGYGDIVPKSTGLRMVAPLEALVGFALVSAGITWLLSMYPAISRQRTLAHSIWLLNEAQEKTEAPLDETSGKISAQLLFAMALQVSSVRSDFAQFPIVYYFHTRNQKDALAAALPVLFRLATKGQASPFAELRLASNILARSIDDLSETIAGKFLSVRSGPTEAILMRYAEDHLHVARDSNFDMTEESKRLH